MTRAEMIEMYAQNNLSGRDKVRELMTFTRKQTSEQDTEIRDWRIAMHRSLVIKKTQLETQLVEVDAQLATLGQGFTKEELDPPPPVADEAAEEEANPPVILQGGRSV